jgi:hypothetical protein
MPLRENEWLFRIFAIGKIEIIWRLFLKKKDFSGKRNALDSNIDEVGKLLARNDGFSVQPYKRPPGYPENYFR